MNENLVILVDEQDNEIGTMEKMEAHRLALLHRAVSVFIVNSKGEWLLQRRAEHKYHSKGLWTNTCCSHPYPNESNLDAAHRRLMEEMGLECELMELFSFMHKEELENGLTEHELDHVFVGFSDAEPTLNPEEAMEWKWIKFPVLMYEVHTKPYEFTIWFKGIYKNLNSHLTKSIKPLNKQ